MVTEDLAGFRQPRGVHRQRLLEAGAFAILAVITGASAIAVKESRGTLYPLAAIDAATDAELHDDSAPAPQPEVALAPPEPAPDFLGSAREAPSAPGVTRWFNGRPVRQVRSVKMVVTAYSPDDRSCGPFADGQTATLHSVSTNATALVAADTRLLPYGTMLTVPGYDGGNIVPVLDCGGAIKGDRLDVLFPTHEEALDWGRRTLRVVIWEYADGGKPENPRRER